MPCQQLRCVLRPPVGGRAAIMFALPMADAIAASGTSRRGGGGSYWGQCRYYRQCLAAVQPLAVAASRLGTAGSDIQRHSVTAASAASALVAAVPYWGQTQLEQRHSNGASRCASAAAVLRTLLRLQRLRAMALPHIDVTGPDR